ncbi:MAG: hypothetical protein MJZ03_03255 [archaeon]|nr:hypothetical protein [archaeon]
MSMIVLSIMLRVVYKDTDEIIDGGVSHTGYFMSGFYNARNDICNKIEALPNIDDIIRRNLKNSCVRYFHHYHRNSVFRFNDSVTNFVADMINFKDLDNYHIVYIGVMMVNLFLLVISIYWP